MEKYYSNRTRYWEITCYQAPINSGKIFFNYSILLCSKNNKVEVFSWEIGNEFFPLYNVVWLLFVSCDNSGERCFFFFFRRYDSKSSFTATNTWWVFSLIILQVWRSSYLGFFWSTSDLQDVKVDILHCIKYRHFTKFPSVKNFWKCTVTAEFPQNPAPGN